MTEREKRQVLLAEWMQKKAEDDFYSKQCKKATRNTQILRREIYRDECDRNENDD